MGEPAWGLAYARLLQCPESEGKELPSPIAQAQAPHQAGCAAAGLGGLRAAPPAPAPRPAGRPQQLRLAPWERG